MRPMMVGHSQGGMMVDAHAARAGRRHFTPRSAVFDPTTRNRAAAHHDPRSATRPRASGGGSAGRVRGGDRHRQAAARPARPMDDGPEAAQGAGLGGRIHRVHDRVGPDRRQPRRRAIPTSPPGPAPCATSCCRRRTATSARRSPSISRRKAPRARGCRRIGPTRPRRRSRRQPDVDVRNLELAADLWYSIRRHWCLEGQRRLRMST